MIFDTISHAHRYYGVHQQFARAFEWLTQTDLSSLPTGRIDIEGSAIYASLQRYDTKPVEKGLWESHRQYIDIQYMIQGTERMRWAPLEDSVPGDFNEEKDYMLLESQAQAELRVDGGQFAIFMPQDVHMPGLAWAEPEAVFKVVIKVRVD